MTLALGALCMIACSEKENTEQINALKTGLVKDYGKSQEEVNSFTYDARDVTAKEAYEAMMDNNLRKTQIFADAENFEMVEQLTTSFDSLMKEQKANKDKTYQAVHTYKLQKKDTLFNVTYYMDGNKIVAVDSKK